MSFPPRDPDREEHQRGLGTTGDLGTTGELGTDPGRVHPYESLYRSAPGDPVRPLRLSPRHWEPSLQPPDGEHQGFGWLYRPDPGLVQLATSGPAAAIVSRPVTVQIAPPRPATDRPDRAGRSATPRKRSRVGRTLVLVIVALLLAAVAVFVVGAVVTNRVPALFGGSSLSRTTSTTPPGSSHPVLPA